MFSTINSVYEYTAKDVSLDLIKRAQAIIEVFIGRDEINVENVDDLLVLDKMTAYQAAYMLENEDTVYNQIATTSSGSGDSLQNYNTAMSAPWIAPLAVMAAKGLSFKRPRSIKTGKIFQTTTETEWIRL